jgi:hypothetical protein
VQLRLLEENGAHRAGDRDRADDEGTCRPEAATLFDRWLGCSENGSRRRLRGGWRVLQLDYAPDSDPVRQRLVAMELEFRNLLIAIACHAAKRGELSANLDVSRFVWEMCACVSITTSRIDSSAIRARQGVRIWRSMSLWRVRSRPSCRESNVPYSGSCR